MEPGAGPEQEDMPCRGHYEIAPQNSPAARFFCLQVTHRYKNLTQNSSNFFSQGSAPHPAGGLAQTPFTRSLGHANPSPRPA